MPKAVFGLPPMSALVPEGRRDIRTVRLLYLVFAAAAGLREWFAAPLLRPAME